MEKNKNLEVVNKNDNVIEMEEKKPGLMARIGSGIKNHWKEGVALILVGIGGYALGKRAGGNSDVEDCDEYEDYIEIDSVYEEAAE